MNWGKKLITIGTALAAAATLAGCEAQLDVSVNSSPGHLPLLANPTHEPRSPRQGPGAPVSAQFAVVDFFLFGTVRGSGWQHGIDTGNLTSAHIADRLTARIDANLPGAAACEARIRDAHAAGTGITVEGTGFINFEHDGTISVDFTELDSCSPFTPIFSLKVEFEPEFTSVDADTVRGQGRLFAVTSSDPQGLTPSLLGDIEVRFHGASCEFAAQTATARRAALRAGGKGYAFHDEAEGKLVIVLLSQLDCAVP